MPKTFQHTEPVPIYYLLKQLRVAEPDFFAGAEQFNLIHFFSFFQALNKAYEAKAEKESTTYLRNNVYRYRVGDICQIRDSGHQNFLKTNAAPHT